MLLPACETRCPTPRTQHAHISLHYTLPRLLMNGPKWRPPHPKWKQNTQTRPEQGTKKTTTKQHVVSVTLARGRCRDNESDRKEPSFSICLVFDSIPPELKSFQRELWTCGLWSPADPQSHCAAWRHFLFLLKKKD